MGGVCEANASSYLILSPFFFFPQASSQPRGGGKPERWDAHPKKKEHDGNGESRSTSCKPSGYDAIASKRPVEGNGRSREGIHAGDGSRGGGLGR